jgi:hypothetical protein
MGGLGPSLGRVPISSAVGSRVAPEEAQLLVGPSKGAWRGLWTITGKWPETSRSQSRIEPQRWDMRRVQPIDILSQQAVPININIEAQNKRFQTHLGIRPRRVQTFSKLRSIMKNTLCIAMAMIAFVATKSNAAVIPPSTPLGSVTFRKPCLWPLRRQRHRLRL